MTMDKSLQIRAGLARARSVLSRDERIARLKEADKWEEGRSPLGLPKVRVIKLAMKKKKKAKAEEGAEGAAAPAAAAPAGKAPAGKAPAAKAAAPAGKK
jgi:small basic protein (TIGR04137 family)